MAAMAMLDEEHDPLILQCYDDSCYTYSSINGHNVVIARMPQGQPGKVSASKLVQPLSQTLSRLTRETDLGPFPRGKVRTLMAKTGGRVYGVTSLNRLIFYSSGCKRMHFTLLFEHAIWTADYWAHSPFQNEYRSWKINIQPRF